MLPLHDSARLIWIRRPWVTWGILAACVILWWPQLHFDETKLQEHFLNFGLIPAESVPHTFVSSLFLHGDLAHLFGNMLYLWIFADNVEDAMGHTRFLAFYLACGLLASLAHVSLHASSIVPLVGASGAISGVLGAYLVLYPKSQILVPIFIIPMRFPAWAVIGLWFGIQVFFVIQGDATSPIAWWAHLAGFAAGLALVWPMRRRTTPLFGGEKMPRGVRLRRDRG